MNEIDCLSIGEPGQHGVMTGVSYNCCQNTLVVSFPCMVLEVEKNYGTTRELYAAAKEWIMGVLSICPGLLITALKDNSYDIYVLNQCGEKTSCHRIDGPFIPQDFIFNPCPAACHKPQLLAFAHKKNRYPYLCSTDISVDDLGFIPSCCNFKICRDDCCSSDEDSQRDVLESIAMIETALSHILNAEGEKIQKALASTDDLDKIMCVNRAVNQTIVNVTHLEHTLYAKLSALADCGLCDDLCSDNAACQTHGCVDES